MTPGEQAAWDRIEMARRDLEVAKLGLNIAAHEAAGALNDFATAWFAGDFRLALDEAEEVATHPDLAEMNVTLDGWYGR